MRVPKFPIKIKFGTRDHDSRSERFNLGNKFVAGLGSQTRPSELNVKYFKRDAITRNRVFHGAKRSNFGRFDAKYGFEDLFCISFTFYRFHIRKFPEMSVHNSGGPLPDKKTSLPLDSKRNKSARGGCSALAEIGQFLNTVFTEGDTEPFYRTNPALRIIWCANQSAQFHERLVEVGASRRRREESLT